jgi:hypothetical protein
MSSFIDDFYNDDLYNLNRIEALLKNVPSIQEDYDQFIIHFKDLDASINNHLYLATIDEYIPISEINIMIERMNSKEGLCVSKYGIYRDCENYLVQTDWFFNLPNAKQFEIRFDFYSTIVFGIQDAFYR